MNDSLIDTIARRLERPPRDVERAMGALVGALHDQLAEKGEAELPGLGRLVKRGDQVEFESATVLLDAVNYRFPTSERVEGVSDAGSDAPSSDRAAFPTFDPIDPEVGDEEDAADLAPPSSEPVQARGPQRGAFKDQENPDSPAAPEKPTADPFAPPPPSKPRWKSIQAPEEFVLDDLAVERGGVTEKSMVAPAFDPGDEDADDVLAATAGLSGGSERPPTGDEPVEAETEAFEPAPEPPVAHESVETPSTAVPPVDAPPSPDVESRGAVTPPTASRTMRSRRERREGGLGRIVAIAAGALILIAAIVPAVLFLRPTGEGDDAIVTQPQEPAVLADSAATAAADSTATAEAPPPAESPATSETPPPPPPASGSGSFGTDAAGYTLVVGSTTSRSAAQRNIQRFEALGLPTAVLAYTTNGETRYRLGVGQYDSPAEADEARRQLSEQLPQGTWVRRIRP